MQQIWTVNILFNYRWLGSKIQLTCPGSKCHGPHKPPGPGGHPGRIQKATRSQGLRRAHRIQVPKGKTATRTLLCHTVQWWRAPRVYKRLCSWDNTTSFCTSVHNSFERTHKHHYSLFTSHLWISFVSLKHKKAVASELYLKLCKTLKTGAKFSHNLDKFLITLKYWGG